MTSKLTFRARTLDASKPMAIHRAEDLPELAAENAINRAVPALPTGMEKEEETEKHLQDILEAQNKGLVKKVASLVIPTPETTEDLDSMYGSLYKGQFKQQRQYIHVQPFNADADNPDYDMDDDDIKFFTEELKERRKFEVSMITFEDMIDRLEKNSGQTVINLKEAKMLLKEDDDLILAVYDYWLNKRLETQQCMIPTVKTEARDGQTGQGVNPYIGFRRRTEKMQTRKNRKNDEDSYIRMLKLRRDINRAVMLLDMVKRREKLKKENLNLITDIFDKRHHAQDWEGVMIQQVQSTKPSSRVLQPSYPLASWVNSVSSPTPSHSSHPPTLVKREKRIYRKRKHHKSGLNRPAISGLLRGERTLLPLLPDPLSSDDDRSSLNTKQSDQEPEEPEEMDGPFTFKRKAGVQYHEPIDDPAPWTESASKHSYFLSAAPPSYGKPEECLGFCRRRLGRGGRVVIDRIPSRWDVSWAQAGLDFSGDTQMIRPVTPPSLEEDMWDPYRVRDVEVCF
eukprot:GFUD01012891.1.p1 GENE.GFUD01012891.1~~GFUD01012891.1.p1  ORF type:complete len:510 (+),score=173.53 GFUD01012891.1:48-1577(+)